MGCVSSSDKETPVGLSDGGTRSSAAQDAEKHQTSIPIKSSGNRKTNISQGAGYETELAASLVEGGGATVAYHGLLVDSGNISLKRATSMGGGKVFVKSVHPHDDGNATTTLSGGLPGDFTIVRGVAMTMPYTIIVTANLAEEKVKAIATKVFNDANRVLNGWNAESELSALNRLRPGKSLQVSSDLQELFAVVDEINSVTEGRYDPTTGALSVAFENCIKNSARPPLPSEVKPLKFGIGWRRRLERNGAKVGRTNANTVIDLDGISKGFVIDKIVSALVENGYGSCYVDWAGDVRASGSHPSGRPWRSVVLAPPPLRRMFTHWQQGTIKDMLQSDDIGFVANFSFSQSGEGGAIATSGDYFSIQKYGYHHIVNGDDLTVLKASETSVASVCVAAATCAAADAIATAAMTLKSAEEAVAFLNRIQSTRPEVVSGFCVMSRESCKLCPPSTYSPNIFARALDTDSSENETKDTDSRHNSEMNEMALTTRRKRVTRSIAQIYFNKEQIVADSFASCSMSPEQLVTFVSPASYISSASLDPDSELNKLYCEMLGFHGEDVDKNHQTIQIQLRFRRIVRHGSNALIVAAIEEIDLGSVGMIEVPFREGARQMKAMKMNTPRSTFNISPLVIQAKELFRQIPTVVWILATKTADQVELGITATSVTVPQVLGNMLCFNISHSSTFFAGLGGLGSRIRGHALSVAQNDLADTFVTRSNLSLDDIASLESDSIMTTDCTVELIESVQDHIIVLARINEVRSSEVDQVPLLWMHGRYLAK